MHVHSCRRLKPPTALLFTFADFGDFSDDGRDPYGSRPDTPVRTRPEDVHNKAAVETLAASTKLLDLDSPEVHSMYVLIAPPNLLDREFRVVVLACLFSTWRHVYMFEHVAAPALTLHPHMNTSIC